MTAAIPTLAVPIDPSDPINMQILAVSEDQVAGFVENPFAEIARLSGVDQPTVEQRIRAMLQAGVIRRVRQTLMATNLASGALIAWQTPNDILQPVFDYMSQKDPFSGHVVIRTTDSVTPGSNYRLWTTLKVPQGYSLERHCELLARETGAGKFLIMPAIRIFVLGVGHVRRRGLEVGSKSDELAEVRQVEYTRLDDQEWRVLMTLKRELAPDEIGDGVWAARAAEAGVSLDEFLQVARRLDRKRVIGRFSTFLEHVKPISTGDRVTRFNGLFHWAVPPGREIEAGQQIGRFHALTHCYWRNAGPEFKGVNIMAVAHSRDKERVLAEKAAMDRHLAEAGIPVTYTNVFWGGRSEIKPSEISPFIYREWCSSLGVDPDTMKEE